MIAKQGPNFNWTPTNLATQSTEKMAVGSNNDCAVPNQSLHVASVKAFHAKFKSSLSAKETGALCDAVRAGDDSALSKLISENLRLVARVVDKYKGRNVLLEDLFSSGVIGLVIGIKKYEYIQGKTIFGAYVTQWIYLHVQRQLNMMSRDVAWPSDFSASYYRVINSLEQDEEGGYLPLSKQCTKVLEQTQPAYQSYIRRTLATSYPTAKAVDFVCKDQCVLLNEFPDESSEDATLKDIMGDKALVDYVTSKLTEIERDCLLYGSKVLGDISVEDILIKHNISKIQMKGTIARSKQKMRKLASQDGLALTDFI